MIPLVQNLFIQNLSFNNFNKTRKGCDFIRKFYANLRSTKAPSIVNDWLLFVAYFLPLSLSLSLALSKRN